ncbi:MAG TPA: protein-glutamate O-methyltransferase CheR [Thermoanaerobaculia bacterium]|nr:protein-glutamate O-methyltransferase CheR [Thermoanaerobaculia bacterium]
MDTTLAGTNAKLDDLESLEIDLLMQAIYRHYGFDFRDYAYPSLKRRIWKRVTEEHLKTVSALQDKILRDRGCMERLLLDVSINVTSMFRDPTFYAAFRAKVVPLLRTYPFIRIWHAGCSTGEEVYSMAILLTEEGLYDRCRIYATDMNETVLVKAKEGIFKLSGMQENTANYLQAGGKLSFSEYYTAKYDYALFRPALREHVVFAQHNLATDSSFNTFNVIVCRNVLIYFNVTLQERVQKLFLESLESLGLLCLGKKESLRFQSVESCYSTLDDKEKLYRRTSREPACLPSGV